MTSDCLLMSLPQMTSILEMEHQVFRKLRLEKRTRKCGIQATFKIFPEIYVVTWACLVGAVFIFIWEM